MLKLWNTVNSVCIFAYIYIRETERNYFGCQCSTSVRLRTVKQIREHWTANQFTQICVSAKQTSIAVLNTSHDRCLHQWRVSWKIIDVALRFSCPSPTRYFRVARLTKRVFNTWFLTWLIRREIIFGGGAEVKPTFEHERITTYRLVENFDLTHHPKIWWWGTKNLEGRTQAPYPVLRLRPIRPRKQWRESDKTVEITKTS